MRDTAVLVIGLLTAINLLQYKYLESTWSRNFALYNSVLLTLLTIFMAVGLLLLVSGVPRLAANRPRKLILFLAGVILASASISGLLVLRQGSLSGLTLGLTALAGLVLIIVGQFEAGTKDALGIFLATIGMALVTLVPVHEAFGVFAFGDLWAAPNLAMMAGGAALACIGIIVVQGAGEPGGRPLASYGLWLVGVMALFLVPFHEAAEINSNNVYGSVDQTLLATGAIAIAAGAALFLRKLWQEREFVRLVRAGDDRYAAGDHDRALEHYDLALSLNPEYAEAWVHRGSALERRGRLEAAQKSLERALELEPDDHLALSTLSAVFRRAGNPGKALALATRACEIEPGSEVAWLNRANALADLKRPEEALEAFERTLELAPSYGKAWYNKGVVLMLQGRCGEAADCFDEVLGLAPGDERALGMRERCYAELDAKDTGG
jgi:Flp pilus assembly protein TadD